MEWSALFDEHRTLHSLNGWDGVEENMRKVYPTPMIIDEQESVVSRRDCKEAVASPQR